MPNTAVRAAAEGMPSTTIQALYREWHANHHYHNRKGAGYADDEMAALCAENDVVLDRMCAIDAQSPIDVLAKILAASGKMEYSVNDAWVDSIRDEALAMVTSDSRSRMTSAVKALKQATMELDPSVTEWGLGEPVNNDDPVRVFVTGTRKLPRLQPDTRLTDLIATSRAATAAYGEACEQEEDNSTPENIAAAQQAADADTAAFQAVCSFFAEDIHQRRIQAAFIQEFASHTQLNEEQISAILIGALAGKAVSS